jgi:hypothetical protein
LRSPRRESNHGGRGAHATLGDAQLAGCNKRLLALMHNTRPAMRCIRAWLAANAMVHQGSTKCPAHAAVKRLPGMLRLCS